ncbi:type II toxin-antitoxin system RelE/ParE family toxin [Sporichthya polymorpha]|uniref:type II toxin-antitoxin system RelE/ParE family toxin n=1 Tax=Sporichthya polymorpha TaxID=35751 RepID=UPI001FE0B7E9|nr:type II toxin-antitoxin system RelE/ParE family toxin [Sporichthya polymorpha]
MPEVEDWFEQLEPDLADRVAGAIARLAEEGPGCGRPTVDSIKGSKVHNLKELRPVTGRRSALRILFAFDPARRAVLLVAGDKVNNWSKWYRDAIPTAERRHAAWLAGEYGDDDE